MRIAFDYGGVLSKRSDVWVPMIRALIAGGAEVFVMTDIRCHDDAISLVADVADGVFTPDQIICCDWETHEDRCKQVEVERLGIDLLIDDSPGYCAAASESCVSLMVWPDPKRHYDDGIE